MLALLLPAAYALAQDAYEAGDLPRAEAQLAIALREEPDCAWCHYLAANIAERHGDEPTALRELRRTVALDPQTSAHHDLGNIALRHVQNRTAAIYANNPTIASRRRERMINNIWDGSLQTLAMVRDPGRGDRQAEDDVSFKTIDGNDIRVDVTVAWQIDPKRAPYLLARVGDSTDKVKEKLVRPACRSIVRDVLNELNSEEFYVSDKRFEKANTARERLAAFLNPEGVLVMQVILGEHHFHPQYEQVIHDKKLAEQNAERLRSEARAAAEQAKSNLQKAKGTVAQQLAQASGHLEQVKLQADADFYQSQKQAEAILTEKKARAKAIQKENEALAGGGGKTLVKLRLAESLAAMYAV